MFEGYPLSRYPLSSKIYFKTWDFQNLLPELPGNTNDSVLDTPLEVIVDESEKNIFLVNKILSLKIII